MNVQHLPVKKPAEIDTELESSLEEALEKVGLSVEEVHAAVKQENKEPVPIRPTSAVSEAMFKHTARSPNADKAREAAKSIIEAVRHDRALAMMQQHELALGRPADRIGRLAEELTENVRQETKALEELQAKKAADLQLIEKYLTSRNDHHVEIIEALKAEILTHERAMEHNKEVTEKRRGEVTLQYDDDIAAQTSILQGFTSMLKSFRDAPKAD